MALKAGSTSLQAVCLQGCERDIAGSCFHPPRLSMRGKLSGAFDKDGQSGPQSFTLKSTKAPLSIREWGF
jgi:hypothetical protein